MRTAALAATLGCGSTDHAPAPTASVHAPGQVTVTSAAVSSGEPTLDFDAAMARARRCGEDAGSRLPHQVFTITLTFDAVDAVTDLVLAPPVHEPRALRCLQRALGRTRPAGAARVEEHRVRFGFCDEKCTGDPLCVACANL